MVPTENTLINRKGTGVTKPARKHNVFLLPYFFLCEIFLPVISFLADMCTFW